MTDTTSSLPPAGDADQSELREKVAKLLKEANHDWPENRKRGRIANEIGELVIDYPALLRSNAAPAAGRPEFWEGPPSPVDADRTGGDDRATAPRSVLLYALERTEAAAKAEIASLQSELSEARREKAAAMGLVEGQALVVKSIERQLEDQADALRQEKDEVARLTRQLEETRKALAACREFFDTAMGILFGPGHNIALAAAASMTISEIDRVLTPASDTSEGDGNG